MTSKITLDEVLGVKYLGGFIWSPDGEELVYRWNDGGITDAWVVKADGSTEPRRITEARSGVSGMKWSKTGLLALVIDGDVYVYDQPLADLRRITTSGGHRPKIDWSPDGMTLAFTNGKLLTFYNYHSNSYLNIKALGEVFAGRFSQTVGADSFNWSKAGSKFLYTFLDESQKPYLGIVTKEGEHIWRSANQKMIGEGQWIDDNRFVYRLSGRFRASVRYYIATVPDKSEWQDYSAIKAVSKFKLQVDLILTAAEEQQRGAFYSNVIPHPNGEKLLFSLENDGWLHHYVYDIENKSLAQLTDGNCEDFGQMGDSISFSPDGSQFVFASNRTNRVERQLWILDLQTTDYEQVTKMPVTNTSPLWSPDGSKIAFMHCDQFKNGDLWVLDINCGKNKQLTNSMPAGLSDKIQPAELITYKGAQSWDIDAFLYKPADFDPQKKYPAIVWVHGGPMRQMRGSWHPSATYSHFYIFNQMLVNMGYIVLSPNFRGGIGYGSEFRYGLYLKKGVDDTIDIVSAGRYLKELPYVDESKVAVYGLSYGGYMTLHSLTQYPEEFAAGINIAGLWDIAQWGRWIRDTYGNYQGDSYFGGDIEEQPALWAAGSPVTYKKNLCRPLMSLQGTADPNVDFAQLDRIVKDCVAMGAEHEAVYYPDEMHTFRWRHTWYDALPRMLSFFETHLK